MSLIVPFNKYTWPMKNPEHRPYAHQRATAEFLICNKNAIVLNDLGTGKTLSALWAADFLMLNKKIKKVLIASPLSTIKVVWAQEIFYNFTHRKSAIAHGTRADRKVAISSKVDFVIINHDGLVTMEQELINEGFDIMIIDELTAFKNHKTDRWGAANRIARKCKAVWGMTAEPTPNSPTEAYAQAKLVNPNNPFLPSRFTVFRDSVEDKITTHISIPKAGYDKLVHRILQPSIRFVRDDCVDIPDCQYIDLDIPLSEKQQAIYKEMHKQLRVEYEAGEITASNAAIKILKLTQIGAGWVKDDEGNVLEIDSKPRLEQLHEIFLNTHRGKLVVAAAFRAAVEGITAYFKSKKIKAEFIHGSVASDRRAAIINDFQSGDLEVIVIQPQSTSHGITLTAADTIVWHSMVPSGEVHNQFNGRITRIGQTRKQTIFYMIGCPAERRIRNILKNKGNMSKDVLSLFADPSVL